jgi:hypothetical protein
LHLKRENNTATATMPTPPLPAAANHNMALHHHLHLSPALAALLHDATHTARLLQAASTPSPGQHTGKLPSSAVHETFILLAYRLQAISPLVSASGRGTNTNYNSLYPAVVDAESTVERAVCLGLTAFVASFFWGGGCGNLPRSGSLRWIEDGVRGVFSSGKANMQGGYDEGGVGDGRREVMLWMLFVGVAAGVFGGGDMEQWVVSRTGEVVQSLGLRDWESVARVLETFPWIEVLHGRKGRAHWERCRGLSLGC